MDLDQVAFHQDLPLVEDLSIQAGVEGSFPSVAVVRATSAFLGEEADPSLDPVDLLKKTNMLVLIIV